MKFNDINNQRILNSTYQNYEYDIIMKLRVKELEKGYDYDDFYNECNVYLTYTSSDIVEKFNWRFEAFSKQKEILVKNKNYYFIQYEIPVKLDVTVDKVYDIYFGLQCTNNTDQYLLKTFDGSLRFINRNDSNNGIQKLLSYKNDLFLFSGSEEYLNKLFISYNYCFIHEENKQKLTSSNLFINDIILEPSFSNVNYSLIKSEKIERSNRYNIANIKMVKDSYYDSYIVDYNIFYANLPLYFSFFQIFLFLIKAWYFVFESEWAYLLFFNTIIDFKENKEDKSCFDWKTINDKFIKKPETNTKISLVTKEEEHYTKVKFEWSDTFKIRLFCFKSPELLHKRKLFQKLLNEYELIYQKFISKEAQYNINRIVVMNTEEMILKEDMYLYDYSCYEKDLDNVFQSSFFIDKGKNEKLLAIDKSILNS